MRYVLVILALFISVNFVSLAEVKINVMLKQDITTVKWIKDVKQSYEKVYPDKKVDLSIISGNEADYYTKASLMLRSSDKIDVVFEDSFMLKSDINAGLLFPVPVEQWSEWKNFFPSLRASATVDGNIYGIPMSTDTRGLFYNVDYFKKAGIAVPWEPKNWNDVIDAARKMKEKYPDVIPITLPVAANGEGAAMQTLQMLLSGTNDVLYKDGKWVLKSQGFLDALKFVDTLYKEKLGAPLDVALNPQFGNKIAFNFAPEQKAAIMLDGCWIAGAWKEKYPKTLDVYKFAAMPTQTGQSPGKTSMSGGWLLSVNVKSEKKDEAFKFIQFALNKENCLLYTKTVGNLTPRMDVALMSEYPSHLKSATDYITYTHFRPANEQYPKISPIIQKAVESVATGQATPDEALKHYGDSVKEAVGDKFVSE